MEKVAFRGAGIRYIDVRQKGEAGVFRRLHMSADYSDVAREAMGWPVVPASVKSPCKLRGKLRNGTLVLTSSTSATIQNELPVNFSEITDFVYHRQEPNEDEGGPIETRLDFTVVSIQEGMAALAEAYYQLHPNERSGALKIEFSVYERAPQDEEEDTSQTKLLFDEEAKPPEEEQPVNGKVVEIGANEPVLASVASDPVTMEERRKKRQQRRERRGHAPLNDTDWAAAEEADPNVPHHLATEVQ